MMIRTGGGVFAGPAAVRVKVADPKDNLDESRIANPAGHDRERWEKYRRAQAELASPES